MTEFRVTIPMPPRSLNPNGRSHWAKKGAAARKLREAAFLVACEVTAYRPGWTWCEAQAVFVFPNHRRRDQDNFAASLKAAWDGLRDAGVFVDDKYLTPLPPKFVVEKRPGWPRGCVEITVRPTLGPGDSA